MRAIKVFIFSIASIVILAVVAIFVPAEYIVPREPYSIEWAKDATWYKLRKYEIIGQPNELRRWLTSQDGAPGQETIVMFILWGLTHQDDFEYIVNGIEQERKPEFVNLLAIMMNDRGLEKEFLTSFERHNSPITQDLRTEIERLNK